MVSIVNLRECDTWTRERERETVSVRENQCDQSGQLLKGLGDNIFQKQPKYLVTFGVF